MTRQTLTNGLRQFWRDERGVAWLPIIGTAVSALTSLWASKQQADAAKKAAAQQVQGTKDAQKYIDAAYQQSQAVLAPYAQMGGMAMNTLGAMGGYPTVALPSQNAITPTTTTAPTNSLEGIPRFTLGDVDPSRAASIKESEALRTPQRTLEDRLTARAARLGDYADVKTPTPASATASGYAPMVQMEAPDGSIQTVPAAQVNHYRRLGARVLN